MMKMLIARGPALLLAGVLLTGVAACENRGRFSPDACDTKAAVGATAVLAVYYDLNGQPVGTDGEDMFGTKNNKMCPAKPQDGPGGCPPGQCPVSIPGRTYCVTCPS